jgi:hypothetical protein
VDAEHGNPGAAVRLAAPAGDTLAARQIWNDHTGLTDRDIALAGNLNDLDGKLMSHDTGIVEEWMRAFVDVVVSAAKAYPARTNQRLTARRGGRGKPGNVQLTWLRTDQRLNEHGDSRNRG